MPQLIEATQVRESFSEIINQVVYAGKEFIVRRQGKPVIFITKVGKQTARNQLKTNTTDFFDKLTRYHLKNGPSDLAQKHNKYTWE